MELFRITQEKFVNDLSGNGARLFGGRWNSEGYYALYTSGTRSLALLEVLAHTPAKMLDSKNYQLITLSVPDNEVKFRTELGMLPHGWDAPDTRPVTRRIGDQFLKDKKHLLLAVPSVILPEELNYVLNPLHADMKKLKIVHQRIIRFDKRVNING